MLRIDWPHGAVPSSLRGQGLSGGWTGAGVMVGWMSAAGSALRRVRASGRPAACLTRFGGAAGAAALLAAMPAGIPQHGGQRGAHWVIDRLPAPQGARWTVLAAVSCSSAGSCTAVGDYFTDAARNQSVTMALRWSHGHWAVQHPPSRRGGLGSFLTGVSCPAANACIAVGNFAISDLGQQPIAERWDGRRWVADPVPSPAGGVESYLAAVSCTSRDACTAVGGQLVGNRTHGFIERWNGRRWSIATVLRGPASDLQGISCPTARTCVAVGLSADPSGTGQPLAERWDGSRWTRLAVPRPAGSTGGTLNAVSCSSALACTGVGSYDTAAGVYSTLAERWQAGSWAVQPVPVPAGWHGSDRAGVSCPAAAACTLVGDQTDSHGRPGGAVAGQWAGGGWELQPVPNPPGGHAAGLTGVACPSPASCLAVGTYDSRGAVLALAEHRA